MLSHLSYQYLNCWWCYVKKLSVILPSYLSFGRADGNIWSLCVLFLSLLINWLCVWVHILLLHPKAAASRKWMVINILMHFDWRRWWCCVAFSHHAQFLCHIHELEHVTSRISCKFFQYFGVPFSLIMTKQKGKHYPYERLWSLKVA